MIRLGKKGFMLAETLVISTVLLITFTFLYSQFFDVLGKFSVYSDYDNVDKLYTVSDVKSFVRNDNISGIVDQLDTNLALGTPQPYVDISACSASLFTEENYCTELFSQLEIDRILFSRYNLEDFNSFLGITHDLNIRMQKYINLLTSPLSSDYDEEYRLIIRFDDGTYSTGRISEFEQVASEYEWSNWLSMGNSSSVNYLSQLYFDGINDYIEIPASVSNDFTIEFSFKAEDGVGMGTLGYWWAGAGLVDGEVTGTDDDFGVSLSSTGQVLAGTGNTDTFIASAAGFDDGSWHTVRFTRDKITGAIKLYVDGDLEDSATGGTQTLDAPPYLNIGRIQAGQNYFQGEISNIRIWDAVTSSDMSTDLEGDETNLVAYYKLSGVNSSTLIDLSGNDNDGSIEDISTNSIMYPNDMISDGYIGQDGVDDYIEIPTIGYDAYTSMSISTDFVMNSYASSPKVYNSVFSWYRSSSGSGNAAIVHVYINSSGSITLRVGNGAAGTSTAVSGVTIQYGQKYNITVTIASGTASLYIDGTLGITSPLASFPSIVAYPMHLGVWEIYEDYGDMDFYNLNIYNRVISTTEMAANMVNPPTENELGLVASYSFDEGAGDVVTDYIGNNHGTIIDGTWGYSHSSNVTRLLGLSNPIVEQLTGKDDGYIYFDGTNDYIEVDHNVSLNVSSTDEITISAWIYPTGTASIGTIASKPAEYFFMLDTTGKLSSGTFYDNGGEVGVWGGYSYSNSKIPLNTWTHVAFSENSNGIRKFYINGILDASEQADASIWSEDTYSLFLGGVVSPARYFKGNIRSINIFNEALTQAEVQNYMFNMPRDTETTLIASYDMEEGTGTAVADDSMYSNDGVKADGTWGSEFIPGDDIVSQSNVVYEVQTKVASYRYNDYSLYFDGVDDYVVIPTLPSTIDFASGFDVEFTATWDQTLSSGRIMDFGNGPGTDNILIYTIGTSTTERFSIYGSVYGYMEMPIPVVLDELAEFKYTVRAGGDFEMYKDDIFLGSTSNAGVISNVDRTLNYLGKSNWVSDAYFNGSMYEFKITDADGDVVLWYKFDEGSGNTVYDRSGNGYDGIIIGASWAAGGTSSLWNIDGMSNQIYNNFLKRKHLYVDTNFLYRFRMIEQ